MYKNELQNSKAMENKKDCKNMRLINMESYLKKQYRYRFRFIQIIYRLQIFIYRFMSEEDRLKLENYERKYRKIKF